MTDIPRYVGLLNTIERRMPGYKRRESQVKMMEAIDALVARADVADIPPILVAEAPCGVGKSMAYSLGAIPRALATGKKVIIATATVALQEQLINKDLPALQSLADLDFSVALVKGRRRYLCLNELASKTGYAGRQGMLGDALFAGEVPDAGSDAAVGLSDLRSMMESGGWSGDRDEYPGRIADADWMKVSVDRQGCLGRGCGFFSDCPFYQARENVQSADVLVINHDLLLCELAREDGSGVLPDKSESILILDEVHTLPNKARDHFAAEAVIGSDTQWVSKLGAEIAQLCDACGKRWKGNPQDEAWSAAQALRESMEATYAGIRDAGMFGETLAKTGREDVRFVGAVVPDHLAAPINDISVAAQELSALSERAVNAAKSAIQRGDLDAKGFGGLVSSVGSAGQRARGLFEVAAALCAEEEQRNPTARWVEAVRSGEKTRYVLHASPLSAAHYLRGRMWDAFAATVACSATVALGDMRRFLRRAGIARREECETLVLDSPFDYANRAELVIPPMRYKANEAKAFTQEIAEKLPKLLEKKEAALVLFCSKWQMNEVAKSLPASLRGDVLVQGEQDREHLLTEHGRRVRAGRRSILFGMQSFAEGLDLPGALVRHVIITKLAFAVPDTPIEAACVEWLERIGRNPFMEITVPDATLRLVQAAGRLLRTEEDFGRVTVLDRRLVTQRYGQYMMKALPCFKQTIEGVAAA